MGVAWLGFCVSRRCLGFRQCCAGCWSGVGAGYALIAWCLAGFDGFSWLFSCYAKYCFVWPTPLVALVCVCVCVGCSCCSCCCHRFRCCGSRGFRWYLFASVIVRCHCRAECCLVSLSLLAAFVWCCCFMQLLFLCFVVVFVAAVQFYCRRGCVVHCCWSLLRHRVIFFYSWPFSDHCNLCLWPVHLAISLSFTQSIVSGNGFFFVYSGADGHCDGHCQDSAQKAFGHC